MAIRSLIGIATAIALVFFTNIPVASSQECYHMEQFFEAVKSPDTVIMMANSDGAKKIVAQLNKNRIKNGSQPVDGKNVVIGVIKDDAGVIRVGVAIFDTSDCVISETVAILSIEQWISFITEAGVEMESFAKLQES